MPEPTQQTTVDAKADEPELGTVVSYNGRYAFVRPDRGGPDVYLGTPELLKANIELLKVGSRVWFSKRQASDNRRPWGRNLRLAEPTAFDELRRANERSLPKREADLVRYDYYFSHPEHRPRKLTRKQLRRRAIRGG
jgi:cold shock CspA family protein